ncbi:MAG: hypothetical protein GVY18_17635 [Bacteroidetes bacterium]|jgi:hypothetical protein|nr:hypothetical protein [Bacteroidota bacterium]
MAEETSRKREYREAQSAFDRLRVDEKAIFLVEATLSTVARGIEEVGSALADELETLFQQEHDPSHAHEAEQGSSDAEATDSEPDTTDDADSSESETTEEDDARA